VYFAFPSSRPKLHAAAVYTLTAAAKALGDSLDASTTDESSPSKKGKKKNAKKKKRQSAADATPVVLATLNAAGLCTLESR
jgi:hypothetical protein